MTKREGYVTKVTAFLEPLMEEYGFELVDVEYVREGDDWYLRAYIDKAGGIFINDCEKVSKKLDGWLDEEDFIEDSYILEVSSPGLARPLKKEKDFARAMGKAVEVKLFRPVDGQKIWRGTLVAYDKGTVQIEPEGEEKAMRARSARNAPKGPKYPKVVGGEGHEMPAKHEAQGEHAARTGENDASKTDAPGRDAQCMAFERANIALIRMAADI
jgi:ribosome maturation factor RimP